MAAAELLAGATPFGWAQLGVGLLGSMAGGAKTVPAGPSSADSVFGSSLFAPDHSNWQLNFGDGATQSMTTGDKYGPTQIPTNTLSKVGTQPTYVGGSGSGPSPSGYASDPYAYGGAGYGTTSAGGNIAGIPVLWIAIGVGAYLLLGKK